MTRFQSLVRADLAHPLTVADVYRLQDEGVIGDADKFELIEGEIVPMAAAKFNPHEQMKSALIRALIIALPREDTVHVETSITLSATTFVEPDICVIRQPHNTQEVRGPDLLLVVEVASSSIAYDLTIKRRLYARYGVRDYWVVDVGRRTVRVHRDPDGDRFADVEEFDADAEVAALLLPGVCVRLSALD